VLLQEEGVSLEDPPADIEWDRFPVKAMARFGWIPKVNGLESRAKELVGDLIRRAGGPAVAAAALYRKNDYARANAKMDSYALRAWCWKVLADANEARPAVSYRPGTITPDFLNQLARLSWSDDGPRLAKEFLAKHGISLVIVRHLPKTYLDGAALKLGDGTPVVGLTLRCDRVDSFWFCLLHELAHLGRHMENGGNAAFVDDLTLREVEGSHRDPKEAQADQWAEEALVPRAIWETSEARRNPTPMAVVSLSKAVQVHPAIVADKIRHERKNYRLLSHFVGTGAVRRQFGLAG
jgi:HTH-type transcriptional regulator / antitoxin HigA